MDLASVVPPLPPKKRLRRSLVRPCVGALLVLALVASLASLALAATGFPDVGSTHPYYAAITDLSDRGIINGYTNGNFGPDNPVTRQQFAKMVVLTGGYPVSEANVCPFADVEVSGPGELFPDNYVAVCAANGITLGRTETSFAPYAYITRYQVVSMVVRMADNLRPGLLALPPESWTGTGAWPNDPTHGANAGRAEYNGLLEGLNLSALPPTGFMSRGEVAQVLHNLLLKLGATPGTTTTTTIPATTYSLSTTVPGGHGTITRNPSQSTFNAGATVTLTAVPATGYTFAGWGGNAGGTTNPLAVTMNANKTISATFVPATTYTLTVTVSGGVGGSVTKSPAKASYSAGETVTLTPVPAAGYVFHHWAGDATGTASPVTLTMNANKTVTAFFAPVPTYTLTVTVAGGVGGTVTKNPAKASYAAGESVVLTPVPAAGFVFHHWAGDATGSTKPLTVVMNASKSITAFFAPVPTYTLTVTVSGSGGTVTKSPSKSSYTAGETVTLTANPATNYKFSYWSGDHIGISSPVTITMDSNKTIYAHFEEKTKYTLSVYVSGGGGSTVTKSPAQSYYYEGQTVTLTANPVAGYVFDYWSGDHIGISTSFTITMDGNKSIYAHFKALPRYTLTVTIVNGGSSTVTKVPNQTDYYQGQTVTLTVHEASGATFLYWGGDGGGGSTMSLTVVMNGNKNITAVFRREV